MQSWDETWFAYPLWIAAAVEIDVGVVSVPEAARCKPVADRRLQICACAPALKTLLHFSRVGSTRRSSHSWHRSTEHGSGKVPHSTVSTKRSHFNITPTLPASQPSPKRSTFNVTAALPWSSRSRSRASSIRLADDLNMPELPPTPDVPPWRIDGHHKSHTAINTQPYEQYLDGSYRPVLEIMRTQSVELASLRQARTRSTGSEEIAVAFPEVHR